MTKKKSSKRKYAANQRNALRSTGPRSVTGKAKASRNALRHGIMSTAIVVKSDEYSESQKEFDHLLTTLAQQYTPVGVIEEILVERIAVSYWRLRRVIIAEQGVLKSQLELASWEYNNQKYREHIAKITSPEVRGTRLYLDMIEHVDGVKQLLKWLTEFKIELSNDGELGPDSQDTLSRYFRHRPIFRKLTTPLDVRPSLQPFSS